MREIVEIGRAPQDQLREDLRGLFRGAIRLTLEVVLEEELKAMVGARRFDRIGSRKDHRNGTYLRRLLTSLGQIDVAVPRSRDHGSPADVMGRYQRRAPEIDEMMVESYVSGVSQQWQGWSAWSGQGSAYGGGRIPCWDVCRLRAPDGTQSSILGPTLRPLRDPGGPGGEPATPSA